jgi:hypothetical protein
MPRLSLPEWANVAEIVASVVIIVSLAYVGWEINHNTRALQYESHQNILALLNEQQLALTTDANLHRVFMKAEKTPFELTDEEWSLFAQFLYPRIGVWEYLYVARREDAVTDTVWNAYEPYFLSIICQPGYRRWWDEFGNSNAPEFIEYVEAEVLPACVS